MAAGVHGGASVSSRTGGRLLSTESARRTNERVEGRPDAALTNASDRILAIARMFTDRGLDLHAIWWHAGPLPYSMYRGILPDGTFADNSLPVPVERDGLVFIPANAVCPYDVSLPLSPSPSAEPVVGAAASESARDGEPDDETSHPYSLPASFLRAEPRGTSPASNAAVGDGRALVEAPEPGQKVGMPPASSLPSAARADAESFTSKCEGGSSGESATAAADEVLVSIPSSPLNTVAATSPPLELGIPASSSVAATTEVSIPVTGPVPVAPTPSDSSLVGESIEGIRVAVHVEETTRSDARVEDPVLDRDAHRQLDELVAVAQTEVPVSAPPLRPAAVLASEGVDREPARATADGEWGLASRVPTAVPVAHPGAVETAQHPSEPGASGPTDVNPPPSGSGPTRLDLGSTSPEQARSAGLAQFLLAQLRGPTSRVDRHAAKNQLLRSLFFHQLPADPAARAVESFYQKQQARSWRGIAQVAALLCIGVLLVLLGYDQVKFDLSVFDSSQVLQSLFIVRYGVIVPAMILFLVVACVSKKFHQWDSHCAWVSASIAIAVVGGAVVASSMLGDEPGFGVLAVFVVFSLDIPLIPFFVRVSFSFVCIVVYLALLATIKDQTVGRVLTDLLYLATFFVGQSIPVVVREYFLRINTLRGIRIFHERRRVRVADATNNELLGHILPQNAISALYSDSRNYAQEFKECSVLFSDLRGFTAFSSTITPQELVGFLNRMYSAFDFVTVRYGLYKVEVIGDAYFATSGCPVPSADHAERSANAALDMVSMMAVLRQTTRVDIRMRIGLDCGPAVAGLVCTTKDPRYHLFGDTVAGAMQMENKGVPDCVHCTHEFKAKLEKRQALRLARLLALLNEPARVEERSAALAAVFSEHEQEEYERERAQEWEQELGGSAMGSSMSLSVTPESRALARELWAWTQQGSGGAGTHEGPSPVVSATELVLGALPEPRQALLDRQAAWPDGEDAFLLRGYANDEENAERMALASAVGYGLQLALRDIDNLTLELLFGAAGGFFAFVRGPDLLREGDTPQPTWILARGIPDLPVDVIRGLVALFFCSRRARGDAEEAV